MNPVFPPILVDLAKLFAKPEKPGQVRLKCNGLPVLLANTDGLMLRLTNASGFEAELNGIVYVHGFGDEQVGRSVNLDAFLHVATVRGTYHRSVNVTHLETDVRTGLLSQTAQFVEWAPRRKPKGKRAYGSAMFKIEFFRPETV